MVDEKNIIEWTRIEGKLTEIKVDDKIFVPANDKFIQFDGQLWIDKYTGYIRHYTKRTHLNKQNKLVGWLSDKNPGFDFKLSDFYETTHSRGKRKTYITKLKMLEDKNYIESFVTPGSSPKYVLLKKLFK